MKLASTVPLGATGPTVTPLALGCMGLTGWYGPVDLAESAATLHHALDQGIDLLDTGDFYGSGANEALIGRVLRERSDRPKLSVKFGALRDPGGAFIGYDGRPASVKNFAAYSLQRLGVDVIDVYRPGRLDPAVPVEDTIGAIVDLVNAGYVRHIGLSEVGPETIRRAAAVHPIVDLQIEYSLVSRGPEAAIFPVLRELGIAVTAYGLLSRGLLTNKGPTGPKDFRAWLPRFQGDARASNQRLVDALATVAAARGVTPGQLAVAWARSKPGVVPLIGPRTRAQLDDLLAAATIDLAADEVAALEAAVPPEAVVGTRYPGALMGMLDSERA